MHDVSQPIHGKVEVGGLSTVYGAVVGVNTGTINNLVQIAQVVTSLHQLRAPLADFVGRQREIATLLTALRPQTDGMAALAAICGMGGLGKTELALRVGHALRHDYPDAQLFISLRSSAIGPPRRVANALRDAIRAFDPSTALPDDDDALSQRYRGLLGDKRALILLDDVPDDASVRPFLPPAGCALLVTARTGLTLGGQGVIVNLSLFSHDEARALLLDDVPRLAGDAALDGILDYCGDLPLAVRIAGSTLLGNPVLTPARYLARLSDETRRLGALKYEDTDVYAVLGVGDELLQAADPALARRWRMLGVCPAPFEAAVAASIWDEVDADALEDALGELVRRSLLRYDDTTRQYRIHELLRDVARMRRSAEDDYTAHLRHAQHYLTIYGEAQRRYDDPQEDTLTALKLFDASWAHIRAAAAWLAATPTPETDRLCVYAPQHLSVLDIRLQPQELIAWCSACAAAGRRRGSRHDEALALHGMGNGYLDTDFEKAKACFEQCLAIAREIGDRQLESWALNGLGTVADALDDERGAIKFYEQVLAIRREIGDRRGEGRALSNLGMAHSRLGDFRHSIKCYAHSLTILGQLGDRHTESFVLNNLGNDYTRQGQVDRGLKYLFQSLSIAQAIGDRRIQSDACWSIGEALVKQGEYARAVEFMQQTVDYEHEIGHPYTDEDAQVLAQTRALAARMERSPISDSE